MENRWHVAHPQHQLQRCTYNQRDQISHRACNICELPITGVGYRCNHHHCSDFTIHEACADRFARDTIHGFFAHPRHPLTAVVASANPGWCDLCQGRIQPGRLVYRCAECAFDVHPLCTLLPMTIHPAAGCHGHVLNLVPARGECAACHRDCSIWHYRCGLCLFMLHIGCVSPAGAGGAPAGARGWPATGGGGGWAGGSSPIVRFLIMFARQLAVNLIVNDITDILNAL
ncbi:protein VACUOLELESS GAMETOPHYTES-like [Oryza sativa Japonica Group]|uniref:Os07g0611400 protein n=2 Tax=Oryza sativa subsp. japonica TaxID=39947 RepID=Q8H5Y7_ORYSJ|nr:hypothetical protein EE612_040627 [Oryza sativa]BAC21311.1 hypothetical protein [Oryza sativa Japonica Group]BAT02610.1 Os07g0611400 [Oryza sativa Japonica Group]